MLINEAYHNFRVIPVDGRPRLSSRIALWGGDSRGRWEGNTLVVEVTNLNGKNRLSHDGDFLSNTARIVERFTFLDGQSPELRGDDRRSQGLHTHLEDHDSHESREAVSGR